MKLDIVDDPYYKFPVEKCQSQTVRNAMSTVMNNLKAATYYVLKSELAGVTLPRPELFKNSRMVVTPFTSAFLYNEEHGAELHDVFKKRIAFVLSQT
jgi:hypothetical protein